MVVVSAADPKLIAVRAGAHITNVNALLAVLSDDRTRRCRMTPTRGDTIHQFFQMYQQMDCAIGREHVSRDNSTGCVHDLQSAVTTTYATTPPLFRTTPAGRWHSSTCRTGTCPSLGGADTYTISDNYHQPIMGGTEPDSVPLGFADQVFFSDATRRPL